MTAGAAIRGPAQEPGTSAFGRLGQGHASRQSTGGVTAGAAICCPTQDLRTSTPGGLGQGHASRHFASLSLEASGSAEPGPELELLKERLRKYVTKAMREAKLRSSWARPNEAFETATGAFVTDLVDTSRPNLFLDDFVPFQARIAFFGMLNRI